MTDNTQSYWKQMRSTINYAVVEDGDQLPRHAEIIHTEHVSPHERPSGTRRPGLAVWYVTAAGDRESSTGSDND